MEMSYPPKILHVGDFALFPKTVSASDVTLFAGVSGDMNPLYLNEILRTAQQLQNASGPAHADRQHDGRRSKPSAPSLLLPGGTPFFGKKADAGGRHPYDPRRGQGDRRRKRQVRVELTAYNAAGELVMQGESVEDVRMCRGGEER